MTRDVDNSQDILDSRDVIARIEELEAEREEIIDAANEAEGEVERDVHVKALQSWDEEYGAELAALKSLANECEGCSDWQYGETLIRDSYFIDYAQELAEDIGATQSNAQWPHTCIDWPEAARELKMDYKSVDFDGVEYWIRS